MSKIIKVSTELEVTVHDFPQGNMREQNRALYELIGNGCDMIEHVMPVRLYNELGHSNHVKRTAVMAGRKETIHTIPRTGIRWMCCNTAPGTRPNACTRHRSPWICWNTWSRPTRTQERQSWTTAWELEAPALPA